MSTTKPNPEQQKAIEHKTGPLLVVAGAGTGKTKIITERIKHLIQNHKINSNEILALTFTEKAAGEMSERVEDVMPLGYEEPWIYTFHSFADRILRAEGLEIGLDPAYKILSGPNQWLLLRKNIFKMGLKYYLPLGNPTKFISAILKFISRLQDEYINEMEFEKYVHEAKFEEEEEKEKYLELAHIYKTYQKLKTQNSKYDFGDLINWCLTLFEQRPSILHKYQKQFKHILVDEFQDTNYAQYLLIKKLFEENIKGRSLLCVGDDSQSIYKFRGAAISNILDFMKDYPSAEMITLNKNYRSSQKILDASYKVIQNNNPDTLESKLGISKKLVELENTSEGPVEILKTQTLEEETELVITKILEILALEPSYTYKDIAILARANSHLDPFVLALRKYGLPYQIVGNRGLYDQDEVRNVLAILRVLINPKDSISLYRCLSIDCFDIPQDVITNILSITRQNKSEMWTTLLETKNAQLDSFVAMLKKYQDKITKATPVELVFGIVNESGYLKSFLEQETIENQMAIKNLDLFLNLVKKFEIEYRDDTKEIPTIVEFIEHIDLLIDAGDNPAQAEIEDVDTINLLTVHASKGLEFPVVFMTNLVSGRFPSRNKSDVIQIPDEIIKETLPSGDEHIQEERRLFYVGMTRAQKYLYLSFAQNYGGKRDTTPSGYLNETGLETSSPDGTSPTSEPTPTLFGHTSGFRDPIYKKIDFTPPYLSFSQIENFKTCPLQYKYKYVLNVPTPPSHALSFGSTIHDTLRDFHSKLLFGLVTLDELFKIYESHWDGLGYLDEDHRKVQFEKGKEILKQYFEDFMKSPTKPLALEKSFNVKIGGIKFYGRIDRIDSLDGSGVEIIDYKTGQTKDQKQVDKDDQVAFYAIAAKEAFGYDVKKLTYYFVESGQKISTTRTQEELETKKEDVVKTIDEIKKGDFSATPGMHCEWCDFHEICPFAYKG